LLNKLCIILLILFVISLGFNFFMVNRVYNYYRRSLAAELNPAGQAITYSNSESYPDKSKIIFFGDSRISQWKALPKMEGVVTINCGIPGQTTAQLRLRVQRDVLDLKPNVAVIQAGINDLKAIGVFPEQEQEIIRNCVDNIRVMVQEIRESGAKVVLMTILPPCRPDLLRRLVWSGRIEEAVQSVNEILKAQESESVTVLDCSFLSENGLIRKEYVCDCLHINEQAYLFLNQRIKPYLMSGLSLVPKN
jgi:lysophospholipase L1-like esterase